MSWNPFGRKPSTSSVLGLASSSEPEVEPQIENAAVPKIESTAKPKIDAKVEPRKDTLSVVAKKEAQPKAETESKIEIRSCQGFDELEACVQLQIETWGYDDSDVIPRKTFLVAQSIGGQVIGAFETGNSGTTSGAQAEHPAVQNAAKTLVGFVFSLPGVKSSLGLPQAYLHSHMLAVKEGYRNRGLGTQLKLEQRREALSRGIRHMEWTFDPLEIKNAFLNVHRLGAIVRSYRPDFYGVSSSRLQGGLPTDRLLAEWRLDSRRVRSILGGNPQILQVIEERVVVPASIYEWKATDAGRKQALAVQSENRRKFQEAFARGLAVLGFRRDEQGNGVFELGPLTQLELN
jgi:predicted GNAT superfamily acetyltransferase